MTDSDEGMSFHPALSSAHLLLILFLVSLQVYPNHVPGDSKPEAKGTPAALLLGYDVRVCRCQHAASLGNLPRERPPIGATALHNDPKEPCRNLTM